MKKDKIGLICILVLFIGCQTQKENKTGYKLEKGGFNITMPGKPTENIQQVSLKNFPLEIHYFSYQDSIDKITYFLSYNDYPSSFSITSSSGLVDNSLNGILNNTNGILESKVDIKHQGIKGKQASIVLENNNILTMQLFLINRRLYQIGIERPKGINRDALNYFNTFNVLSKIEDIKEVCKVEIKIIPNDFKINNQKVRIRQSITKSFNDFSGELPITIDNKTIIYKLYFIDNRNTEFKSLLLFNIYYRQNEKKDFRLVSEGVIPITSSEFESSYKAIINNNLIDFNYTIKLLN